MKPRLLIPAAIVVVLVAALWLTGLLGHLAAALRNVLVSCLEFIQGLDPALAALTFAGFYILATLLFVPGLLITMAAGLLFGVVKGAILVSFASVAGASLAFLIGRYLARDWIAKKLEGRERFQAIDHAIGADGARVVLLLRLSPAFPYNLLNYSLGLTRIGFAPYLLASWIGMFPGTLMYVYLGSLAGSVAALATETGAEKSPAQWILFAVGLLATILITVYVTRLAKRALDTRLPEPES